MILNRYEIFLKTAEIGNITKTAEILHYTQAGISHAIAALEKETGFSLLARSASGVTLTENGKRLLPYIQTLVNDQHGLSQAIYDINETVAGTLRIATFTSVSTQWLPTIIRKFQADYPLVEFDLLAGDYDEITERILSGRVDCGFIPLPVHPSLETVFLERDQMMAVLPLDHPLASRETFPLEALDDEPFMILEKGAGAEVEAIFKERGIKPRVNFTTWDDYAIMAMVEKGLGISILTEMIMRRCPYKVVAKSLEQPVYRDIVLAFRGKERSSLALQRFIEYLPRR